MGRLKSTPEKYRRLFISHIFLAMESENKGKTGGDVGEECQDTKDGIILAPIEVIIPVEVEEKPKKKKKKVKRADKVRNLTLSLGEAIKLITQEEMKKKRQMKDEEIRKLAMEQKAKKAAASGHDTIRQGVLIHI